MSKKGHHGFRNPKKSQKDRKGSRYGNEDRRERGGWSDERIDEKKEWRQWIQNNKSW